MNESLSINLRNVTVVYNEGTPDEVVALRNVSLSVKKGETLVVTGGNGSGKSTLLKTIAGTVPIKSGSVFIEGIDVTHWSPHRRANFLGFIHQDPMLGTCPSLTFHENLRLVGGGCWWWPFPERFSIPRKQRELIESTGLPLIQKSNTMMSSLSGGQRQGAALILALSSKRSILLMDEFTSSLDDVSKSSFWKILSAVAGRQMTILGVLHDLSGTDLLESRYIHFTNGTLDNPVSASADNNRKVY